MPKKHNKPRPADAPAGNAIPESAAPGSAGVLTGRVTDAGGAAIATVAGAAGENAESRWGHRRSQHAPLPEGWVRTTLGAVHSDLAEGIEPSRTPDKRFELYSVPSFPSGRPEIVEGKTVGSSKQTVCPDTVLVCKINPRINRVWVVGNFSEHEKIASTEWIPFWPVDGVLPHYLCYYLQQHRFRDYLAANASGVGGSLMRVKRTTLANFPLVLPPLPAQRAIASKLDELFTDLDAGVAALERAKAKLKRYRASVLKAAVEGRLTEEWRKEHFTTENTERTETGKGKENRRRSHLVSGSDSASVASVPSVVQYESGPELLQRILAERRQRWEADRLAKFAAAGKPPPKGWQAKYPVPAAPDTSSLPALPEGWCWATADQLCQFITDGEHATPPRTLSGVYLLSARNVGNGRLTLEEVDFVATETHERLCCRLRVQVGDVLLSCAGTVGRSCVIKQPLAFSLVRSVAVLRPVVAMGEYLSFALRSHALQVQIDDKKTETAQANIFQGKIKQLVFPIGPAVEQQQIVAEVERRLSIADEVEAHTDTNLKRAARLRQAVLKRAFAGQLRA